MITSVPCRPSVVGCPGARHGVPVDLARHKGRVHCGGAVISRGQRGSNKSTITRTKNNRVQASGKQQWRYGGYIGGYRYVHEGPGELPVE